MGTVISCLLQGFLYPSTKAEPSSRCRARAHAKGLLSKVTTKSGCLTCFACIQRSCCLANHASSIAQRASGYFCRSPIFLATNHLFQRTKHNSISTALSHHLHTLCNNSHNLDPSTVVIASVVTLQNLSCST